MVERNRQPVPWPILNTFRDGGLTTHLGGPFHFQKVLLDRHFFLSLGQRLSLWDLCLIRAVLFRIAGNINLIFVLCGKFISLERIGTSLLRCLHAESLGVFNEVDHAFWNFFPTHPFAVKGWDQKIQIACSVSRKHIAISTSFVMEVTLHTYGARTGGGGRLMGGGSEYQAHSNVLWLVEHFLYQNYWRWLSWKGKRAPLK